ncbi:heme-binding domain-containing protein [Bacteroidota bacterium]
MSKLKIALIIVAVILIAIQFIPVNKTNPPVTAELNAPADIISVFKRSCYDCHSYETEWPWYSNIAPVSWLISSDVKDGRLHLNFSKWKNFSRKDIVKMKEEIWEEIERGKMPLGKYIFMHPEAELDQEKKDLIKAWAGE